jgi:CheY-like chemotaxis protein
MGGMKGRTMKRVLVIEDDPVMREVVKELLREFYDVETADDGLAGVYAAHDCHPDLIILDLSMPRMGGWDVIEMLHGDERTIDIPIVVMTALTATGNRERAEEAGCAAFVEKPFDGDEFLQLITEISM